MVDNILFKYENGLSERPNFIAAATVAVEEKEDQVRYHISKLGVDSDRYFVGDTGCRGQGGATSVVASAEDAERTSSSSSFQHYFH